MTSQAKDFKLWQFYIAFVGYTWPYFCLKLSPQKSFILLSWIDFGLGDETWANLEISKGAILKNPMFSIDKKLRVLQKKVLSFWPNWTVEVRPKSSAEPNGSVDHYYETVLQHHFWGEWEQENLLLKFTDL